MRPLPFLGAPPFSVSFWIACVIWIVPEIAAWKLRRSPDAAQKVDRGSLGRIVLLWWLGIAADFVFALYAPIFAIPWKREALFFGGIALMPAGAALRWYSAAVLGRYFTFDVAVQNQQVLITAGPYRYVRHPSYTGALISLVGLGLALGNWAGLAASLSCMGYAYWYRIRTEETALIAALGKPYQDYVARTWRLVPFVF